MAPAPQVEFFWFRECPNHERARELLLAVLESRGLGRAVLRDIDASEPEVAVAHRFPGSPTIRIDGVDIEPDFEDPGDYTPRCRLYLTAPGYSGIPERTWIESAIDAALGR
jgi:hypothetical protein